MLPSRPRWLRAVAVAVAISRCVLVRVCVRTVRAYYDSAGACFVSSWFVFFLVSFRVLSFHVVSFFVFFFFSPTFFFQDVFPPIFFFVYLIFAVFLDYMSRRREVCEVGSISSYECEYLTPV